MMHLTLGSMCLHIFLDCLYWIPLSLSSLQQVRSAEQQKLKAALKKMIDLDKS